MSPSARRGISKKTSVSGTGLHTGARTEAAFLPAPAGQGIVFRRVDLAGKPQIPALLSEVEAGGRPPPPRQGGGTNPTPGDPLAPGGGRPSDPLTLPPSGPPPPR